MTNRSTLLSRKYYSNTHKCSLVDQTLVNKTSTHGLSFTLKSWAESLVLMSINYAWPLLEVTSFTVDNSENFPTSFQYSCRYKICGDILKLAGTITSAYTLPLFSMHSPWPPVFWGILWCIFHTVLLQQVWRREPAHLDISAWEYE